MILNAFLCNQSPLLFGVISITIPYYFKAKGAPSKRKAIDDRGKKKVVRHIPIDSPTPPETSQAAATVPAPAPQLTVWRILVFAM